MCTPLFLRLQTEYASALASGDTLEGAVLIGNVPVPMASDEGNAPLDQVYMDILDANGNPYASSPFKIDANGYYLSDQGDYNGDSHLEIWVSRINAQYMGDGLREGGTILDENQIYENYLNKVANRMLYPANVPSRGFAMGGPIGDHLYPYPPLHATLGNAMVGLNLPWLAEFTGGENSSFNWMSQLLAGPRGCINYGAFNGSLFPTSATSNDRNERYCRYNQLNTVYLNGNTTPATSPTPVDPADSLGWEWAGLYGHSCPVHTNFSSYEDGDINIALNGTFSFGTYGPFFGSNYLVPGGYNGSYYSYQDNSSNPNPYNYGNGWKGKQGQWRFINTTKFTKNYNVYLFYMADFGYNCQWVTGVVYELSTPVNGVPQTLVNPNADFKNLPDYQFGVNQRTHINNPLTDPNWELLRNSSNNPIVLTLNPGEMGLVTLTANDGVDMNHIFDAVQFIATDGTTDGNGIVDDAQPANYSSIDKDNAPYGILSTPGFIRDGDQMCRGYEDMGNEPGGNGFAKPCFFLTMCCGINVYNYFSGTLDKNIGNLYALGHNGLICMGTATSNYSDIDYQPFVNVLSQGGDFGQAFLAQQNSKIWHMYYGNPETVWYSLLGAGSLRSKPYSQYGSIVYQGYTITSSWTVSSQNPVLISNTTVNGAGNWKVTSTHNTTSPWGTHSEIIVMPETDFAPTGTNVVDLVAN
jgi:hypothetical protein